MAPLNSLGTWAVRSSGGRRRPKSRCFFIGEGPNTEFWYLSGLAERLARMDVPELMELRTVERTGDEKGQSAPVKLLEHALAVRDDEDGKFGFDPDADSVVVFFDADVYKGDEEGYLRMLERFEGVADVAVTYPSFELFLLLHLDNAVEEVVGPNEARIVENGYVNRRRFVEVLASERLGMNVKRNSAVSGLSARFGVAASAEPLLNQDPAKAVGRLTSNVADRILEVVRRGSSSDERFDEICGKLGVSQGEAELLEEPFEASGGSYFAGCGAVDG